MYRQKESSVPFAVVIFDTWIHAKQVKLVKIVFGSDVTINEDWWPARGFFSLSAPHFLQELAGTWDQLFIFSHNPPLLKSISPSFSNFWRKISDGDFSCYSFWSKLWNDAKTLLTYPCDYTFFENILKSQLFCK